MAATPTVRFGRAVDVYGWRAGVAAHDRQPFARAVVVGPDAIASLPAGCTSLPVDPVTGRKRILIAAEIGSAAFVSVLQALRAGAVEVGEYVPRDAAFVVTWPATTGEVRADRGDRVELVDAATGAVVPSEATPCDDGLVLDPMVAGTGGMPPSALQLRIHRGGAVGATPFQVRGLLPDPEPLHLVGEMTVQLERVARRDDDTRVLTLFFGGLRQAVDRGDVLRCVDPATQVPIATCEVLTDVPLSAIEGTQRAHVCVRTVRDAAGEDVLLRLDPGRSPAWPPVAGAAREAFVRAHGPKVTLVALFEPEHGDDPANFVRVDAREVVDTDANREGVSPHAALQVRFSAPVDPATLSGLRLLGAEADPAVMVPARIVAADATDRVFQLQAPLGLLLTPQLREQIRADRERPPAQRRSNFVLDVAPGPAGVKTRAGKMLVAGLRFGFVLDPQAADNFVAWRAFPVGK